MVLALLVLASALVWLRTALPLVWLAVFILAAAFVEALGLIGFVATLIA